MPSVHVCLSKLTFHTALVVQRAQSCMSTMAMQESRARWNSLDGVLIFGWSGSALLGGILVDKYGFDVTFCITALMQGIGACFLVPLVFLVPRTEAAHKPSASVSPSAIAAAGANTGLAATDVQVLGDGQMGALDELDEEGGTVSDLEQPLLINRRKSLPSVTWNYLGASPSRGSVDL